MVIILFFADIGIGVSGELVNNKNSDYEIELQRNPAILVDGLPPLMCDYCLLYTSPSPRDKRQSRMPSSA